MAELKREEIRLSNVTVVCTKFVAEFLVSGITMEVKGTQIKMELWGWQSKS